MNLLPKMELQVVVEDSMAEEVIEAIIQTARTGEIGDGRVFGTQSSRAIGSERANWLSTPYDLSPISGRSASRIFAVSALIENGFCRKWALAVSIPCRRTASSE